MTGNEEIPQKTSCEYVSISQTGYWLKNFLLICLMPMVALQLGTGLVCTGVKRDTHLPDMVIDKGRMALARLGTTRRQEI